MPKKLVRPSWFSRQE